MKNSQKLCIFINYYRYKNSCLQSQIQNAYGKPDGLKLVAKNPPHPNFSIFQIAPFYK